MKYLKTILFFISIVLILNLLSTILYYFNITSEKTNSILKIINFVITFIVSGIHIGRRSNKKGWIEGLKISSMIVLISILTIMILPSIKFTINTILYYVLIVLITSVGSMIGINFKLQKK